MVDLFVKWWAELVIGWSETGGEGRAGRQGHRDTVGSYRKGGAYERGTPAEHSMVD